MVQRSDALGLSSAEVTILMRLNADIREIATLSPGESRRRIHLDALGPLGNDHVRNVQEKTVGDF
jgi:hypothetical protein